MVLNFRKLMVLVIVFFLVLPVSANAASINGTANSPWFPQWFKHEEAGVKNLSTAFVGKYEVPMLSYSRTGQPHIYEAFKATPAVPGNCGPGNAWVCNTWNDSDLIPGSLSQMATMQYIDSHTIRWAYSAAGMIRGASIELMNDMSFVDDNWENLIQISKFGDTLIGTPSIQVIGGHYMLAATIMGGDLYDHKLVYMHYTGNTPKTSCISAGSVYDCVVIDQSLGFGSIGAPSLQVTDNGSIGIAYYKSGEVMYAYPHDHSVLWPSNCGPEVGGNETWRCITIFAGTETGTVGQVVKLAAGKSLSESGIAFTYDDELIPVTLYHADYVGSGGNCGWDGRLGLATYRWHCEDIVFMYNLSPGGKPSFSIDIDPDGYSVMAYDYRGCDLCNNDLNVAYPKARIGDPDPGWITEGVDGAPVFDVETGAQAAISINSSGRGFISYLQEEDYVLPDLKIALQGLQTFLPITAKP